MSTYKTKWGRSVVALMAAALVFTGLPGTEAQAAKKAKLSTKKLTVTVGKKKTIKIKNKAKKATYKFKSKKASIAKVSKKGVVTGKKKGSTKITVTEKKGKKTRKVGTVTVKVNPVKKPNNTKTPAPSTSPVVVPSTNPTQPSTAPDNQGQQTPQPQASTQPSKNPATPPVKASKPPTPPPTDKPTPTPDGWKPKGKDWVKIDLSKWDGDEGNYLETGDQFILEDVEAVSVPLPETPVIDQLNQKVEVLVRGSVSADSEGFRFWLVNSAAKTMTGQYEYMASGHRFLVPPKDNPTVIEKGTFEPGKSFQLQNVFTTNNWDQDTDITCKSILLKATAPGGTLAGITITGIWVRYGDNIGSSIEDPSMPETPVPSKPPVESEPIVESDRVFTAADLGGKDALSYTYEKVWAGSSNLITYKFTADEIAKIKAGTYTSLEVAANIIDATAKSNCSIQLGIRGKGDSWGSKTDMFYNNPFKTDKNGPQTQTLDLTKLKNSKEDPEALVIQVEWDDPKDDKTIVFDGDLELTSLTFKDASGNGTAASIPDESKKSNMTGLGIWLALIKVPLPADVNLKKYSKIIYEVTVDGSPKKLNAILFGEGLSQHGDHTEGITNDTATLDLSKYESTITDGTYSVGVQTAEEGFAGNVSLDKITLVAKK